MQEIDHTANPFPGLRPFESNETHLFFGRDGQSEELLRRLKRTRFLAVVGTSGSGKSSLVRAGLLPALQGGLMASAGSDWRIAILRPGGDPIGNLASALVSPAVLGSGDEKDADIQAAMAETTLRRSSLGLVELVSRARTKLDEKGEPLFLEYENLLVVVDQFEELFRFKQLIEEETSKEDAAAFVKLLLEAVGQKAEKIYVVLTMRSDFLGDCSQFWELPEAINNGQYLIPRMTRDERREAISGPVAVGQGEISDPLVNQLLNDVGDNPDQLPIMQHALMRTWDHWLAHRRNGDPIDIPDYNAIGGMAEALSRHADEAYAELDDKQQAIAEKLFKGLTEKGTDNREIRRPMEVGEICELTGADEAAVIAVVEVFRREGRSFLMPPPTDALTGAPVHLNRESLIDISHESLIRNWDRLKIWVDEEARSARIYRRLAETAVLHKEGGAGLWRDPDLGVALTWREQNVPNKVWARRYHPEFPLATSFLDESVTARDEQLAGEEMRRRREIKRTRLTALIFAIAFIFSLAMGVYAYSKKSEAQRALIEAKKQQAIAYEAKDNAEKALAQAKEQRGFAENAKGQALIEQQRAVDAGKIAAARAIEADKQRRRAEQQAGIAKAAAIKADRELATNQSFRHATSARQRGNDQAAEKSFQEAFNGFRQLQHYDGMADTYVALGELLLETNRIETSSENTEDTGNIFTKKSPQREQAVKYLDDAAAFYSRVPDNRAAAETLVKSGESFDPPYRRRQGPTDEEKQADLLRQREGVQRFERALKNFELVHDDANAVEMLKKISTFYENFKADADRRKALAAYEQLSHYTKADSEPLIKAAQVSFVLNETARADEYLGKAVKLHRDAAEVDEAVGTLVTAGEYLASELKDKERAGLYFKRALELCHEICAKKNEANMLIRVGKEVDSRMGDQRAAVGYFEKAAQIHRELGDKDAEAQALTEIAELFNDRCEVGLETSAAQSEAKAKCEMAIQYLKRALAIYQASGDLQQQSVTVSNIADVYEKSGETQLSLESRRAALALAPASEPAQRASILRQNGKAQSAAGQNSQALETYKELLALQVTKGDEHEQAMVLKEIGDLQFQKLKQPQEAVASYQRALLLYDRIRGGSGTSNFLSPVQYQLHQAYLRTKRNQ
jgi:tetratricopeptide (TPR) repeat protein/energy-coupling factor transporter ATP-binding protein EcfA2